MLSAFEADPLPESAGSGPVGVLGQGYGTKRGPLPADLPAPGSSGGSQPAQPGFQPGFPPTQPAGSSPPPSCWPCSCATQPSGARRESESERPFGGGGTNLRRVIAKTHIQTRLQVLLQLSFALHFLRSPQTAPAAKPTQPVAGKAAEAAAALEDRVVRRGGGGDGGSLRCPLFFE